MLQIEGAADVNTDWYLRQWEMGREPPCCAGCANLVYKPDRLGESSIVDAIPHLLKNGCVSCAPAVAMSLGHERASLIAAGGTWPEAKTAFSPVLERQDTAGMVHGFVRGSAGVGARGPRKVRYWHALMRRPDGSIEDVTEELKRGR